jgi:hypothetical protein
MTVELGQVVGGVAESSGAASFGVTGFDESVAVAASVGSAVVVVDEQPETVDVITMPVRAEILASAKSFLTIGNTLTADQTRPV